MKRRRVLKEQNGGHAVDLLLPICLFFVLAASSILVTVFSAGVYQKNVALRQANYNNRLCLNYITEKVRQNDQGADFEVGTFDGLPAILIARSYNDGPEYVTALYFNEEEGTLYESFVPKSQLGELDRSSGDRILQVENLIMAEEGDRVLYLSCEDESGQKASTYLSFRSDRELRADAGKEAAE